MSETSELKELTEPDLLPHIIPNPIPLPFLMETKKNLDSHFVSNLPSSDPYKFIIRLGDLLSSSTPGLNDRPDVRSSGHGSRGARTTASRESRNSRSNRLSHLTRDQKRFLSD